MRAFREGTVRAGGGAACAFVVPRNGSHWSLRASAPDAVAGDPIVATLVLVGQSGETELFSGPLKKTASLIDLPVTLPGERLVLRATKPAKLALEVAWIQSGPADEEDPCAR